ncbi:MAG: TraB/VirB10 family protein [Campylobacterota bacterium]|nr:TraB/VirB10 family protein [Campylobacterota bacterium]
MIDKFKAMFDKNPTEAKSSQNTTKMFVFMAVAAIFMLGIMLTEGKNDTQKQVGEFAIVEEQDAVKTAFMGEVKKEVFGARKDAQSVQQLSKSLKNDMQEIRSFKTEVREFRAFMKDIKSGGGYKPKNPGENYMAGSPNFPPMPRTATGKTNATDMQQPATVFDVMGKNGNNGGIPQLPREKVKKYVPMNDFFGSDIDIKDEQSATPAGLDRTPAENILPSGSILHVSLLSGIDAPTLSKAKKQAVPLLMKVTDLGVLPNNFRYDVESCFILGEGYGDLSAERVYIRTTTLSCVTHDGLHIDGELTGFVAGADAKNGIRGRVVSKQGALLARTAVAGFMKGAAEGFNMQNQVVTSSALGTTTGPSNLSTTDIAQMGFFNGASEAAERLSDFYMDIADELTPVIEISANIEADVIVTEFKVMDTLESGMRDGKRFDDEKKKVRERKVRNRTNVEKAVDRKRLDKTKKALQ